MKTPDLPTELLIDGAFVAGEGVAERVLNPATGELLMALPLVPMHEVCPEPPVLQAGFEKNAESASGAAQTQENPEPRRNPFAVLAGLKKDVS